MTTLAAYCQSMGWDINDPRVKSTLGNISADTELREDQMDSLQEAMYTALGAQKPGDDPMVDAFGGKHNGNRVEFQSYQNMVDYLNSTVSDTNSPTYIRNKLSKQWQKANSFSEYADVVMDVIANAGAYMPWNW